MTARQPARIGRKLAPGAVGALSELRACVWLIEEGWEVYRNVTAHGLGDIIAFRDGEMIHADVKTKTSGGYVSSGPRPEQIAAGVALIYVDSDGGCEIERNPTLFRTPRRPCVQCAEEFQPLSKNHKVCQKRQCREQATESLQRAWKAKRKVAEAV